MKLLKKSYCKTNMKKVDTTKYLKVQSHPFWPININEFVVYGKKGPQLGIIHCKRSFTSMLAKHNIPFHQASPLSFAHCLALLWNIVAMHVSNSGANPAHPFICSLFSPPKNFYFHTFTYFVNFKSRLSKLGWMLRKFCFYLKQSCLISYIYLNISCLSVP